MLCPVTTLWATRGTVPRTRSANDGSALGAVSGTALKDLASALLLKWLRTRLESASAAELLALELELPEPLPPRWRERGPASKVQVHEASLLDAAGSHRHRRP